MSEYPPKPSGTDEESVFHQANFDKVHGASSHFNSTSTVKVTKTTKGWFWHAREKGSKSAPASTVQLFTFFKMFGDYYLAKDSNGAVVQIAKQPELRNSITSAWIDGNNPGINNWTYTYPNNPGDHTVASWGIATNDPFAFSRRTATLNGQPEKQAYVPRYKPANAFVNPPQAASLIYAIKVSPNTGVLSVGADTTTAINTPIVWLELTPRLWVRLANQA